MARLEMVSEIDPASGNEVLRQIEIRDRLVDDELPEVATAYLRWIGEQA